MLKSIRFRLYPTDLQKEAIDQQLGCCRFIYNWALDYSRWEYKTNGVTTFRRQWEALLPSLKTWLPWLKGCNAQALQQELRHLDAAYNRFYKKIGAAPTFKTKHSKQSFSVPQGFRVAKGFLTIPKIKEIKCVVSKDLSRYELRSVSITKTTTGKYFASVLYDDGLVLPTTPVPREIESTGIDLGLKHFAVLSTGEKIAHPRHYRFLEKRLARQQRHLARKSKGSNNRSKSKHKVALTHERIVNRRNDFLHKLSTKIVNESQGTICVETLNIKGLLKNRSLAKSIQTSAWGDFVRQLKYKSAWYGKNLLQCGTFDPTSKTCSECGRKKEDLKLADRSWVCGACGTSHDRDMNAARNIVRFAFRNTYPEDTGNLKSVERKALATAKAGAKLASTKQKATP